MSIMLRMAQFIAASCFLASMLLGYSISQVRVKPPDVYQVTHRMTTESIDEAIAALPSDAVVAANLDQAKRSLSYTEADLNRYRRYATAQTLIAIISLGVLVFMLGAARREKAKLGLSDVLGQN